MTRELRDKARTLGPDRLTDEHLTLFERATAGMERRVSNHHHAMSWAVA